MILAATTFLFLFLQTALWARARRARKHSRGPAEAHGAPSLSVIVPIGGASEDLEGCLKSWAGQDYAGALEYIFSMQEDDPVRAQTIRRMMHGRASRIIVNSPLSEMTAKVSNNLHALPHCRGEIVAFMDMDVLLPPGALTRIAQLARDEDVLVTCLPVHGGGRNLWGAVRAYTLNLHLLCYWAPALLSGRKTGAVAAVLACHRRALERVGGVEAYSRFLSEDLAFGRMVREKGGRLALGPEVYSRIGSSTLRAAYDALKRAHVCARLDRRGSHVRDAAVLATDIFYFIPFCAALVAGANVTALAILAGRGLFLAALGHSTGRRASWWTLGFIVGDLLRLASFISAQFGATVRWYPFAYRLAPGGRILEQRRL